ncbi:MAG: ketoacyl-ACP synthase III [Pseudomonadota bacterium]
MAEAVLQGINLAGVSSCVPASVFDNREDTQSIDPKEVKKVVAMAGVEQRRVATDDVCSSDLCLAAANELLGGLGWSSDSIDGLIFVTQTPDYFLPSTSSLLHRDLKLRPGCAAFDVGLGCSGYPYGLWLGSMMISSGSAKRVLVLHGETPSRFTHPEDRSTFLLFGDAGSATALERSEADTPWGFCLFSDGSGYDDLIIPAGGFRERKAADDRDNYVHMNGGNLFNFTVKEVPALIEATLALLSLEVDDVDAYVFHQSNRFIMRHIAKKCGLPADRIPVVLDKYGNSGGPSVPLALTHHAAGAQDGVVGQRIMMLGYGVGLSWGSACLTIEKNTQFHHCELETGKPS